MHKSRTSLQNNQDGLVAIVVTMIIMLILSLIVLGFAQLTRREQRQSLDRQLSTQAFYAAETGVNDTISAINGNAALLSADYTSDCDDFTSAAGLSGQVDGANVVYSCLLVDPSPTTLGYTVEQNKSQIFPLQRKDGANLNKVTFSWEDSRQGDSIGCTYPTFRSLPQTWPCPTGVLRVEIVAFGASESRNDLIDERMIVYLQPNFSGGGSNSFNQSTAFGPSGQGNIIDVECNVVASDNDCSVEIQNLSYPRGYVRLTAMYAPAAVQVQICDPNCNNTAELTGAQVLIDVTGRAVDVLRRMQVRSPLASFGRAPEYAVQTFDTFCKRIALAPPSTVIVDPPAGGFDPASESVTCQP